MLFIEDLDFQGKTVFLRVDFNVPMDHNQQIRNDARIQAALPTLQYLLDKNARVILASHLGRPKGKVVSELSMKPVAKHLQKLISAGVKLAPSVTGQEVELLKRGLKENEVLVLENLRFDPAEKTNDPEFARELANGIDIYVNDAFGTCHRSHASVVAITGFITKSAAGFLIEKEVEYLNKVIRSPQKPYIAILGGAKAWDKIPIIQNLLTKADTILIGGAIAYTFFSAQGKGVGKSLVETDKKEMALSLLQSASGNNVDFELPEDHIIASNIGQPENARIVSDFPIPREMMALDIGPRTIEKYISIISSAETILWNGPMGVFEVEEFSIGTTSIAEAVASSNAMSIVGGGDSVAAIAKAGVEDRITHISTGGGASLEYIANERLPGLEALSEK